MLSGKTFTDRRICRTFAKLVENKMKSTSQSLKIEDKVHNNENREDSLDSRMT